MFRGSAGGEFLAKAQRTRRGEEKSFLSQRRGAAEGLEGGAFHRLNRLPGTSDGTPPSASMPSLPT